MSSSEPHPPAAEPGPEPGPEPEHEPPWIRFAPWIAGLIALVGLALRIPGAYRYWLNADEGIYYTIAHQDWDEASVAIASNAHPPLFYWIVRAMAALSDDLVALRWPSLLAGAVSIYLAFALTRRLTQRAASGSVSRLESKSGAKSAATIAGWLAAVLVALSPAAVMLSQVVRPYALQSALVLGSILLLYRFEEDGRTRDVVGYSILMTAAMAVHYSSMLVFAALGIVWGVRMLTGGVPRPRLLPLLLAQIPVIAVAAYTGYAHVAASLFGGRLHDEATRTWLQPFFLDSVADAWPAFLGFGEYLTGVGGLAAFAVFAIAGLGACVASPRTRAFGAAVLVALALAVTLSRLGLYPFGGHRHSFYLFAMTVPAIAGGVVQIFAVQKLAGAVLVSVLGGLLAFDSAAQRWLGADPERPAPFRELEVEAAKLRDLRIFLQQLAEGPGLILMDTQTASSIAPFFPESFRNKQRSEHLALCVHRERTLVFADTWVLQAGTEGLDSEAHLLQVLLGTRAAMAAEEFEHKGNDVWLLSCQGARLPNQITRLARAVSSPRALLDAEGGYWAEDYSCARVDVAAFLAACQQIARRGK